MRRVVLIILVLLGQLVHSQQQFTFRAVSLNDGLSNDYVESVYEDSYGFVWIGTRNGLNRYDGHSFQRVVIPEPKDKFASLVSRNYVLSLTEDSKRNLWIGTLSGVYVYDRNKNLFHYLWDSTVYAQSINRAFVEQIVIDDKQNAWIGTRDGLFFRDTRTDKMQLIKYRNANKAVDAGYICAVHIDVNKKVWVATRNAGLYSVSKNELLPEAVPSSFIRGICSDKAGTLWVLTSQNGLFYKEPNTTVFKQELLPIDDKSFVYSCINCDKQGNLWLGTNSDGVVVYNTSSKGCKLITQDLPFPRNIVNNSIQRIFCDRWGNVWVATQGGGVSVYSPIASKVDYYFKTPFAGSIKGSIISCFCTDYEGKLWVGSDGGGLSLFNRSTGTFENYTKAQGLTSNAVLSLCEIEPGILAVATWNGGFLLFNTKTRQFTPFKYISSRNDGNIQDIYGLYYNASEKQIWCNTFGDGVQIFDYAHKTFLSSGQLKQKCPYGSKWPYTSKIVFGKGSAWLLSFGLVRNTENGTEELYFTADSSNQCKDGSFTTDILFDSRGVLWFTNHRGLVRYSPTENCLQPIAVKGHDFSDAQALLSDKHGNIWFTTSHALFRYTPQTGAVVNFTQNWGMPRMEYFRKSAFRAPDGHLYFGGMNGFVVLHEDSSYNYRITPQLVINKITINAEEQTNEQLGQDVTMLKELVLDHDQSFLSLSFAALNYIDNQKSKYRYKLEGFDKEWILAGSEQKATYTNIPPGKYTFLLYTTQSNGKWSETPFQFNIRVKSPWWQQWWFIVLLNVVIIIVIVSLVKYREFRIVLKNKKLRDLVAEKTQEIQASNEVLLQQKETIERSYDRLRENQLVIEMKNDQLQEALTTKDRLITVVAHDFRNPLNTLLGFARILQRKIEQMNIEPLKMTIEHVVKSSESLQDQMEIVLDWSIGNNDTIKVKPVNISVEILINDVFSLLYEMILQKGIHTSIVNNAHSEVFVDTRMVSTIFRNLITNSIKFTPNGGTIEVRIEEHESEVLIKIIDSGPGISDEQINVLLYSDNAESKDLKSGFGLQIVKAFIRRNNGRFLIENIPALGSVFLVFLPKNQSITVEKNDLSPLVKELDNGLDQQKLSMLVADDSKDTISFLREIFQDSFEITEAYNGYDARLYTIDLLPDIILSDINMPMLDGKKLCQQLKSEDMTNHIPIILISAQDLPQNQVEGLLHGADDYVTKPFDADVLRQKVFSIVRNRQLLMKHYKTQASSIHVDAPPSYDDKIISHVTEIILNNLSNADFSVEDLTETCGLSRSQLYRKTMAILGQSPSDYIKTLRFQHAAKLLKTGKYRISEVAYEVGFSDARYFSSSFSKYFGITPSGYKEGEA